MERPVLPWPLVSAIRLTDCLVVLGALLVSAGSTTINFNIAGGLGISH